MGSTMESTTSPRMIFSGMPITNTFICGTVRTSIPMARYHHRQSHAQPQHKGLAKQLRDYPGNAGRNRYRAHGDVQEGEPQKPDQPFKAAHADEDQHHHGIDQVAQHGDAGVGLLVEHIGHAKTHLHIDQLAGRKGYAEKQRKQVAHNEANEGLLCAQQGENGHAAIR